MARRHGIRDHGDGCTDKLTRRGVRILTNRFACQPNLDNNVPIAIADSTKYMDDRLRQYETEPGTQRMVELVATRPDSSKIMQRAGNNARSSSGLSASNLAHGLRSSCLGLREVQSAGYGATLGNFAFK
jgi:hypothetical protein